MVAALIEVEALVKSTGHAFRETAELHLWRFASDGRISHFRHYVDLPQHLAACQHEEEWVEHSLAGP